MDLYLFSKDVKNVRVDNYKEAFMKKEDEKDEEEPEFLDA